MSWYYGWRPYVPVAQRRARAAKYAAKLAKKENRALCPIQIPGRKIAQSFWGLAWCDNLEQYSDFANRLPRGRTYVRNGSVIDLQIETGQIKAIVSGSDIYKVKVSIETLPKAHWTRVKRDCAQEIDSLIDLLQGRFDEGVMKRLTQPEDGLFPKPKEIKMHCSCPDWAGLCKHVAAVLYGVGSRLDSSPELLFVLRGVDHLELISQAVAAENLERSLSGRADNSLAETDLGKLFGIEMDNGAPTTGGPSRDQSSTTQAPQPVPAPEPLDKPPARTRAKKEKPPPKRSPITTLAKKARGQKPAKRGSKVRPKSRPKVRQPA